MGCCRFIPLTKRSRERTVTLSRAPGRPRTHGHRGGSHGGSDTPRTSVDRCSPAGCRPGSLRMGRDRSRRDIPIPGRPLSPASTRSSGRPPSCASVPSRPSPVWPARSSPRTRSKLRERLATMALQKMETGQRTAAQPTPFRKFNSTPRGQRPLGGGSRSASRRPGLVDVLASLALFDAAGYRSLDIVYVTKRTRPEA